MIEPLTHMTTDISNATMGCTTHIAAPAAQAGSTTLPCQLLSGNTHAKTSNIIEGVQFGHSWCVTSPVLAVAACVEVTPDRKPAFPS